MRDGNMESGEFHSTVKTRGKRLDDPASQNGFSVVNRDRNRYSDDN